MPLMSEQLELRNRIFAVVKWKGTPVHDSLAHSQFAHPDLTHVDLIYPDITRSSILTWVQWAIKNDELSKFPHTNPPKHLVF